MSATEQHNHACHILRAGRLDETHAASQQVQQSKTDQALLIRLCSPYARLGSNLCDKIKQLCRFRLLQEHASLVKCELKGESALCKLKTAKFQT